MKRWEILLCGLAMTALAGCGGGSRHVRKKKPKRAHKAAQVEGSGARSPAAESKTPAPAARSEGSAMKTMKAASPKPSAKPSAPAAPRNEGSHAPTPGGKGIGQWIKQLDSKKKDDVIEACSALSIAGRFAKAALPKLEELSKHADKEIAAEAKAALAKIKK